MDNFRPLHPAFIYYLFTVLPVDQVGELNGAANKKKTNHVSRMHVARHKQRQMNYCEAVKVIGSESNAVEIDAIAFDNLLRFRWHGRVSVDISDSWNEHNDALSLALSLSPLFSLSSVCRLSHACTLHRYVTE